MRLHATILALGCLIASASASEMKVPINIEARLLVERPTQLAMQITVVNSGRRALRFYEADLPWATRHSMVLVAITNDRERTRLDEALTIDDPGPRRLTLEPGGKMSGTIDLVGRFPKLLRTLQERPVILFWTYQTKTLDDENTTRASDALVIPRNPTSDKR